MKSDLISFDETFAIRCRFTIYPI